MTPKAKKKYTIHNWKEYKKALTQRGSITFWFSQDAINKWQSQETSEKKGSSNLF